MIKDFSVFDNQQCFWKKWKICCFHVCIDLSIDTYLTNADHQLSAMTLVLADH